MDLASLIRDVPNFPVKGVLFKDITTLMKRPDAFREAVDVLVADYLDSKIDVVAAIESRGFIFGAAVAYRLGAGFVPVRKPGKLPAETISESYTLEYGVNTLQIHQDAIEPGQRVLIVDDLLATGGSARATANLVERLGGEVVGLVFLVELDYLHGRKQIEGFNVRSIIHFESGL
jgi:adenine phosphoribosyltransferase